MRSYYRGGRHTQQRHASTRVHGKSGLPVPTLPWPALHSVSHWHAPTHVLACCALFHEKGCGVCVCVRVWVMRHAHGCVCRGVVCFLGMHPLPPSFFAPPHLSSSSPLPLPIPSSPSGDPCAVHPGLQHLLYLHHPPSSRDLQTTQSGAYGKPGEGGAG